jgi:hypothetical protein
LRRRGIRRRCGDWERRERKRGPGEEGKEVWAGRGERRGLVIGERREEGRFLEMGGQCVGNEGRKRQGRDGRRNGGHAGMKKRERERRKRGVREEDRDLMVIHFCILYFLCACFIKYYELIFVQFYGTVLFIFMYYFVDFYRTVFYIFCMNAFRKFRKLFYVIWFTCFYEIIQTFYDFLYNYF